jgi:hypothetical protein
LIFVVVMAVGASFVGEARAENAVSVTVVENDASRIVLRYDIGAPIERTVRIDGEQFTEIRLSSEPVKKVVAAPALPEISRSVIIPDDQRMAVRVLSSAFTMIDDVDIAPSRGVISRQVDPSTVPYFFGDVYETDAFWPEELAWTRDPYILRDHRGMVVTVNPFQYNPVQRTLRAYRSMTIEIAAAGKGAINVMPQQRDERRLSRAFHEIYSSHFVNYNLDGRYDPMNEDGSLLVICHDPWMANVQAFVDHKNAVGISTDIVGVSTIGNNATAIKQHIQNLYDTSDLAFVLLVGDEEHVRTMYPSYGASDPSYSKLAGSDDYPEIIVGRFSAQNVGDLDTQVERTIEYELMPATMTEWFWRGMGVASNQGPGDDGEYDDEHVDNIRDDLLAYGYTEVDQIYDPYATAQMVADGLNAGRGIINYTGHGSPTSWGSSGFNNDDIDDLVNDNMLPFITTVACNNGEFDSYDTCFAEKWLRATNNGEPIGAIGCYASSISQSWDPPMEAQDEFNLLFCAETYNTYGALCFAGSCSMMDDYDAAGVSMFDTWHIFGDPTLRVVGTAEPPTGMRVSPTGGLSSEGPNGGPFTPAERIYILTNYDPQPIDFEVSTTASWLDLSTTGGTIPVEGTAEVVVSINAEAADLPNGYYEEAVEFVNLTNHDGDTTRLCSLEVGVPVPVIVFDFDEDPGWTMEGEWEFGEPTGQGGESWGNPDPTGGATGSNVYGINLAGDYLTDVGGPYHLTSNAIDCSNLTQVSVHFQRWLNSDYQPYVAQRVAVSVDGVTWTELWNNGSDTIADNSWNDVSFDLSEIADNEPTVYLRWSHEVGQDYAWAYSGWNIDDVTIWGVEPSGDCVGDCNGDDVVDVADLLMVLAAWGDTGTLPEDINGDSVVDVTDLLMLLAGWGGC